MCVCECVRVCYKDTAHQTPHAITPQALDVLRSKLADVNAAASTAISDALMTPEERMAMERAAAAALNGGDPYGINMPNGGGYYQ